jgi:hypothetical protein
MAGYGNKRAEDPNFDGHETRFDKHTDMNPYQGGHETYKSGTVGGAGFGNKGAPESNMDEYDNSEFRFGSHHKTDAYSGASDSAAGSGSTAGAGYGNKTGSFESSKGEYGALSTHMHGC